MRSYNANVNRITMMMMMMMIMVDDVDDGNERIIEYELNGKCQNVYAGKSETDSESVEILPQWRAVESRISNEMTDSASDIRYHAGKYGAAKMDEMKRMRCEGVCPTMHSRICLLQYVYIYIYSAHWYRTRADWEIANYALMPITPSDLFRQF